MMDLLEEYGLQKVHNLIVQLLGAHIVKESLCHARCGQHHRCGYNLTWIGLRRKA